MVRLFPCALLSGKWTAVRLLIVFVMGTLIFLTYTSRDCRAQEELSRPFRDKWAVVIGISKFVKPELDLKYADKDAASFYEYLVAQGGFARDHVRLLTNEKASRRAILSTLGSSWLSRLAAPDDLVVIYISSHGSAPELDSEGVNYLLASDSDPDDLYSSGIDMQALARMIKAKVHANRVVIFLDTCYSGAGATSTKGIVRRANADAQKIAQSCGQIVIASSAPDQVSWECAKLPNSVFTNCLVEALKAKGESTRLADAFSYLQEKVEATVRQERGELQTPVMKSPWTNNNLVLCAPASAPQSALLSDYEIGAKTSGKDESAGAALSRTASALFSGPSGAGAPVTRESVALLPFEEGDQMGLTMPDFDGLARLLEEMVRLRLSNTLGDKLLSPYEVGAALGKTNLGSVWTVESRQSLGRACRAKYLVKVRIPKAHFDESGNLDFAVSVCVASGESGDYIWSGGNKAGACRCEGDQSGRLKYLKQNILPPFSTFVSRAITAAVSPK